MLTTRSLIVLSFSLLFAACSVEPEAQAQSSDEAGGEVTLSPVKQSSAETEAEVSDEVEAKVLSKFREARPDIQFADVSATEFPGLYQVEFSQGGVIYVSESGDFFLSGQLFKIQKEGVVNLTEQGLTKKRKAILAGIDKRDMITFPAEGDDIKDIYVFTDVSCGFCVKLHNEIADLGKLGIRVNYLAYPRGGANAKAYSTMQSVWCSDDPQGAMTAAKAGERVQENKCSSTTVLDQFALGNRVGVSGTPAIVFEDGSLMPGYRPSAELAFRARQVN